MTPSSICSLAYAVLHDFTVEDESRKLDYVWKASWPLRSPQPGWPGMTQSVCDGIYPGQGTFLPMIDMDPTNMSCMVSTLHSKNKTNTHTHTQTVICSRHNGWVAGGSGRGRHPATPLSMYLLNMLVMDLFSPRYFAQNRYFCFYSLTVAFYFVPSLGEGAAS